MFTFTPNKLTAGQPQGAGWRGGAALWQRLMPALRRRAVADNALEHLGSLPLTAQSSLALVRLQGETLLLGVTAQNITLLAKGTAVAAGAVASTSAQELLSR